jgi:acetate kinase
MSNHNKQQQAVILKGIAQQILQMNVPTFNEVSKLFEMFEKTIDDSDTYSRMYKAVEASVYINDKLKENQDLSQLTHKIVHYAFKYDTAFEIRNAVIKDLCT